MSDDLLIGKKRRSIEDKIVERFRAVNFKQKHHAYLEDDCFWDFVFSWYELVKYYEESRDTAIGAHMLDLFTQCGQLFRIAAADDTLRERRRDKAADALYQITYYVDRMIRQAERNGVENESARNSAVGDLSWNEDDKPDVSGLN